MTIAIAASVFSNSVGVNIQIDKIDSTYQNYAQMINALSYVGVTNVRDTYDDVNDAAEFKLLAQQLSLKFDFYLPLGSAGVPWQIAQIEADPSIVSYVEGFNESDAWWQTYDGLTGAAATQAAQAALYTAVKSDPALSGVGVIQTSFANIANFNTYGNQSAYADYANTHSYFGSGNNPDYGNWANYLISLAQNVTPGKPTITTEAGYFTEPGNSNGVDQLVQAKYLLDLFFEQAQAGVKLTYIFDLLDNYADPNNINSEDHFGLFNADYTPKIAAIALHNLMQIFQDPGTGGVQPGNLNYTLNGMPSTADSSLYEKSDGTFMLVLWNDARLSGPTSQAEITVPAATVTLTLTQPFTRITVYDPLTGTTAIQEFDNASTVKISVPDHPVIVEMSQVAAPATPAGAIVAAPSKVLTTPGQAVHVDGLSVSDAAAGNYTVQVSSQANGLSLLNIAGHILASKVDTVTLTGSLATINAELATLNYTGQASTGSDMISVSVTDPNGASTTRLVPVSVVTADTAIVSGGPAISVPSAFSASAGSASILPNLTIADPYAATHNDLVTLTVKDTSGKLQVTPGAATVSGNASSALTIAGSLAQVTSALASLTYTAGAAAGPDTILFNATDAALTTSPSSGQTTVTVTPPPTLTGPSVLNVIQGKATPLPGITLADTAAAAGANQVTVGLTVAHGSLAVPAASGVTGSGTGTLTLSGTVAAVDAELSALTYTMALGGASDTVAVQATDLYGGSVSFAVPVQSISATPPSLLMPSGGLVRQGGTLAVRGIIVSDTNATAQATPVTVTVTDTLGMLSATSSNAAITGTGSNTLSITGSVSQVNAALGTLAYTAGMRGGADQLIVTETDGYNGAVQKTLTETAASPQFTLPSSPVVATGQKTALSGISLQDASDGKVSGNLTVHVSTIASMGGTVSITNLSGATQTGSGNYAVTLVGTLSQINAALSTLTYTAGAHNGSDDVIIDAWDQLGAMSKVNLGVGIGAQKVVVANGATPQVITGYSATGGLLLDLRQVMAETGWDGQNSTLSKYLQVRSTSGGTMISINPNGAIASSHDVALLQGVTASMSQIQSHDLLIPNSSSLPAGVTVTDTGGQTATISGQQSAVATALDLAHYTSTSTAVNNADPTTNSTVLLGWNNVLDAGAGYNFLNGLQPGDIFRLNAPGQGVPTISGFTLTNGDQLDITRALTGLNVASDLSNVGSYLTATVSGSDTMLYVNPTSAGGGGAIARLMNVNTSVSQLLADHSLIHTSS